MYIHNYGKQQIQAEKFSQHTCFWPIIFPLLWKYESLLLKYFKNEHREEVNPNNGVSTIDLFFEDVCCVQTLRQWTVLFLRHKSTFWWVSPNLTKLLVFLKTCTLYTQQTGVTGSFWSSSEKNTGIIVTESDWVKEKTLWGRIIWARKGYGEMKQQWWSLWEQTAIIQPLLVAHPLNGNWNYPAFSCGS